MLLQGLTITVVGMSVVFIFLALLVIGMKLLSTIIPRFFPEQLPLQRKVSESSPKVPETAAPAAGDNAEIAAALAAISVFSKN